MQLQKCWSQSLTALSKQFCIMYIVLDITGRKLGRKCLSTQRAPDSPASGMQSQRKYVQSHSGDTFIWQVDFKIDKRELHWVSNLLVNHSRKSKRITFGPIDHVLYLVEQIPIMIIHYQFTSHYASLLTATLTAQLILLCYILQTLAKCMSRKIDINVAAQMSSNSADLWFNSTAHNSSSKQKICQIAYVLGPVRALSSDLTNFTPDPSLQRKNVAKKTVVYFIVTLWMCWVIA